MFAGIGAPLIIGAIVAMTVFFLVLEQREKAAVARVEREGQTVIGWIVMANKELITGNAPRHYSHAQIVFTPRDDVPDLPGVLHGWARKLVSYQPPTKPTRTEYVIGSVMRTHIPYWKPLRLPDEISGGIEGYTISLRVLFSKLPEGRLTLPFVYCKYLPGEEAKVLMTAYPRPTDEPLNLSARG